MDLWFDALFGIVAGSFGTVRRAGRSFRHPGAWDEGDRSVWTWLAAFGLLLPVVPLGLATVRFAGVALQFADDDLLWVLGLLIILPLAAFAVVAACMLASWAVTLAAWLLTGREHAAWFAGGYLAFTALLSWPFFGAGFSAYGWTVLGTTAAAALLLLARAAARPVQSAA